MSDWFTRVIRRSPEPLPPDATRAGLLAEVIARPDDDEPRWVAADWFTGQGDPRGEFIAAQLTLAALEDDDSRREELEAHQAELLARHKAEWVGRFRGARTEYGVAGRSTYVKGNPTHWTFERGFVDTVKMAADDFAANAGELLTHEPVRRVSLTQARGRMRAFLEKCPELPRIRELDLSRQPLEEDDLMALFTTDRLTGMQRLNLSMCRIGQKRGKRVFETATASFPALRTLSLMDTGIGDPGVRALAESPILEGIEHLALGYNKVGTAGAQALLASEHAGSLVELRAPANRFDDQDLEALRARFQM